MSTLGERVAAAREQQGWTQAELGERIGMTQQGIAAVESGVSSRPKKLRELARALAVTEEHLLGEDEEAAPPHERTKGQRVASVIPGRELQTSRMMPVYAGAEGGAGKLIISLDPVDHVKLPAMLENVAGAYGLLIQGVSMVPAFEDGDTALVNPNLRPQRGRNVILYHTPPDGVEAEAIVKRLNGWNDREWDLEQYNPAKKFKEFRQEWPVCHRVVGKYEAQ